MRIASKLTTTTALLALAGATPALAEKMNFTVAGYFTQSLQLVDTDNDFEDEVLAQNAEIHFKGKTKLDNGTELGFQVQLEAEGSASDDQIDEHYLYMRGEWGKLIIGAENGVGHLMQVRAPRFVPGLKFYDNSLTDDVYEGAYHRLIGGEVNNDDDDENDISIIEDAHMSTKLEHISGDANKLSYMTPRVGGLQLGGSYTPNNADRNGGENNAVQTTGTDAGANQDEIIEMAVSFKGRAAGLDYKLSYTTVDGNNVDGESDTDPKSSSTGLAVSYGDWLFGGNISEYEHLDAVDNEKYANSEKIETSAYGLKYKLNKASHIGLGFTEGEETHTGDNAVTTEFEEMSIGGGTKLSDGVAVGYYYTKSDASHGDDEGEVSMLGMTLDLKF